MAHLLFIGEVIFSLEQPKTRLWSRRQDLNLRPAEWLTLLSAIMEAGRGETRYHDPFISTALPLRYTGVFSWVYYFTGQAFQNDPDPFPVPGTKKQIPGHIMYIYI